LGIKTGRDFTHLMPNSMLSRRKFLFLLLALLSLDFGVSEFRMKHGAPADWKTERWQAGFGSWCCGGYMVAYDISMPKDYDLTQKCGKAWVESDKAIDEFLIEFSFFGTASPRYDDKTFADYLKTGAVRSAESFGRRPSDIEVGTARPYDIGLLRFSRSDISLDGETQVAAAEDVKKQKPFAAGGFHLKGNGMSIISELNSPAIEDVNERIIRSMRRVGGFSLIDAMAGSVPFLNGC
jgi:hypothetical protein